MKKKTLIFYYIIPLMFCQVLAPNVGAITEAQETAIIENCSDIKESLKKVQKDDSKTRVYLGGYYEAILTRFITPLNIRLVENNLSSAKLIENQNEFVADKSLFADDFIVYQKNLEDLVSIDCKEEPEEFYEKLDIVRQKRAVMVQDTLKIRSLLTSHVRLVEGLKGKI